MISPFQLELPNAAAAYAVHVTEVNELHSAVNAMGLRPPRATVVVVGGAAGLDDADHASIRKLFVSGVVPVMEEHGAVGVDGGTRAGVMRLFGEARSVAAATFPLVGVVAGGTVQLPGGRATRQDAAVLDPNHTHFVIVPGDEWGAESPWIAETATVLAGRAPSVTVLINGGQVAYSDVERSVQAGRRVVVIAGSGRTADEFADALAGGAANERATAVAKSGLLHSVPADEPGGLAAWLNSALGESATD